MSMGEAMSLRVRALVWALLVSNVLGATTTVRADCDADELFGRGRAAYDRGEYVEAATLLLEAYDCHADPALLFNAARAYDRARDRDAAIATYERYLASSPTSEAGARARAALAALRAEVARETAASETASTAPNGAAASPAEASSLTPDGDVEVATTDARRSNESASTTSTLSPTSTVDTTSSPRRDAPPRRSRAPGVAILAGLGAASAAGAVTLRWLAVREADRAEDAANHADGVDALSRARRFDRAALTNAVLSAASSVAAVVWARAGRAGREVDVAAGLGGVVVRGAF
jgi:tetratricopeptide (TPR) repeat protein